LARIIQEEENIMSDDSTRSLVAIVNTSEEVALLLRRVMEHEGYRTVTAYVPDFKRGEPDPEAFFREHDPAVVVWDIAIPYQDNWELFREIAASDVCAGRRFVLTTTNKTALESLVGPTSAHEMIGRPFDLGEICDAVCRAFGH
jgi:DNA-binding response OmpR family regulator